MKCDKLKILMVAPFPDPEKRGGMSGHIFSLTHWLGKCDKASVTLACFGKANHREEYDGCRVITLKKRQWYRLIPFLPIIKISRIVRKEKPDILHIQGSTLSYPLLYALLFAPKKLKKVVTIHGHPVEEGILGGWLRKGSARYHLTRWAESRIPRRFDGIITVTSRLQDDLNERYSAYAGANFYLVPNGVNPEEFKPSRPADALSVAGISRSANHHTVLNAKALMKFNGQEFLIRAINKVAKEDPSVRLLLIGAGPELHRLQELTTELEITERVHFLGRIPNDLMPSALAIADVVVLPSLRIEGVEEGSSLGLLEAMSSAKPVIASNIGGLREAISDGKTGLLVPEQDAAAIADAILRTFRN